MIGQYAGEWRLVEELGQGGMGQVFRGVNDRGEERAVKVMVCEPGQEAELAARFALEAKLLIELSHTHIVKAHHFGELETGAPYLVMELLRGQTLAAYVQTRGPVPAHLAVEWLRQAAEGVAEAHLLKIIHRDLKPENLFLCEVGGQQRVKVLDFGVARALREAQAAHARKTQTNQIPGTPGYMAPEMARGQASVRSDVYALGIILYELLLGRHPLLRDDEAEDEVEGLEMLLRHREGALPQLPMLSAPLQEIAHKMVARAPDVRYADAREVAAALAANKTPADPQPAAAQRRLAQTRLNDHLPSLDTEHAASAEVVSVTGGVAHIVSAIAPEVIAAKRRRHQRLAAGAAATFLVTTGALYTTTRPAPVDPMFVVGVALASERIGGALSVAQNEAPTLIEAIGKSSEQIISAVTASKREASSLSGYKKIKAISFSMGSPTNEAERFDDETMKTVFLNNFYIKETEVTQDEWSEFSNRNPSKFKGCGGHCPVEQVNWYEGAQYMNWMSRRDGVEECYEISGCSGTLGGGCRGDENEGLWCEGDYICKEVTWRAECNGYRYPTEAEWEFAARGGDERATYNGELTLKGLNHAPELDDIAVYGGNSGVVYKGGFDCSEWPDKQHSSSRCGTAKVRTKAANGYGLCDMLGNVSEWTWDATPSASRVYRGCGWSSDAKYCRAANRSWVTPGSRRSSLGLRPARSDR